MSLNVAELDLEEEIIEKKNQELFHLVKINNGVDVKKEK